MRTDLGHGGREESRMLRGCWLLLVTGCVMSVYFFLSPFFFLAVEVGSDSRSCGMGDVSESSSLWGGGRRCRVEQARHRGRHVACDVVFSGTEHSDGAG